MDRFAFLAGLPRTGSTVLATLLSQHPDFHTTRTSFILHLMDYSRKFTLGESPYFDVKDPQSPVWGVMRGILFGAYEDVSEEYVIEKSRGWAKEVRLLRSILKEEPKIIAPVRPIPEIISSFILLSNKIGKTSKIEEEVRSFGRESNVWTLSRIIWEKYIQKSWQEFKAGYENDPDNFLILEYDDIVSRPNEVMRTICTYLDVEPWAPTTTNLKNPNPEKDSVYGMPGLHTVKPELKRTSPPAWEILGEDCYEFWEQKNLEFWRG